MLDLIFVALLALWAAGFGHVVLRTLGTLPAQQVDLLALAVPLGLGMLALGVLALGVLGVMTPAGIASLLVVGLAIMAADRAIRGGRGKQTDPDGPAPSYPTSGRWLDLAFGLALAAGLVGTLLQSLVPATDGDALCYHLQVPKVFLAQGATSFEPDLHETVYPLGVELLYAVALAFRGPVACRLVQWIFGLAFAANVAALARPMLGLRAWWACAVALLVPAVTNGMSAPLNDVALAAYANAALHAFTLWAARPTARSALLAGMFGGLTIGVKYPALPWVGLIAIAFLPYVGIWTKSQRQCGRPEAASRPRLIHLAVFGVAVLSIGGWWYLRSFVYTGNPVFPYFRGIFGAGIDEVLTPDTRPLPVTIANLLTALIPMTLQPDRFDSLAHQFGPVFLLFLPGLLLLRPPRRVGLIVGFGFVFLMLCLTQRQSMRFVLAALGPFAVGVAWLASQWLRRGGAGRALAGLLALALLAEAGIAVSRPGRAFPVLTGRESAEEYLARVEPTWRVGRWIDANLPADARLVGQDHRGFYIPRPYAMELAHRRRTGLAGRDESAAQIIATLRDRKFTHLMLCPPEPEDAVEFDPTLGRRLAPWLEGRRPLFQESLADGDGVVRRYAIYALADEARVAAGQGGGSPR